jgi:hypothetical protein
MIPDVSVILPTIRVHLLEAWYESLVLACPSHTFEVVCCGPFEPPPSILQLPNFTFLLFRIQSNSPDTKFSLSKRVVCSVDHMPNVSGDHKAMHIANSCDIDIFKSFWKDSAGRNKISLNNYQRCPEVWNLRFTGTEKKYEDLV